MVGPRVAVIGAGLAGLRCADVLLQHGASVTIFEARRRLGGRVHQDKVGDHLVDLGPNWIHGSRENAIGAIAETTGTCTQDWESRQTIFDQSGNQLDEDTVARISDFIWTTVDAAFAYSRTHGDSIPAETSLLDYFRHKALQAGLSASDKLLALDACKLWGAYVGDPVSRQSLKFFFLEECIDGANLFVASTYSRILEHVSRPARERAEIHLNEPVVKIDAQPRLHLPGQEKHPPISLTTSTAAYTFDEVVVTCPLGWLKRNKSAFSPALPPRLVNAIDAISYGRLEKVYVTFPRAFWHAAQPSPPPFTQFLEPTYAGAVPSSSSTSSSTTATTSGSSNNGIEWSQECVSLAALPAPHAHPTLLFYLYGPCAAHIAAQLHGLAPSSDAYAAVLDALTRPFYSRLHGFCAAAADCRPRAFLATQWQNDPLAGYGSYCNFQVGVEHADIHVETLRAGAGIGPLRGLWFAGEHTAPFVALGTTTGAYCSGERAASQICAEYRLSAGL